MPTVSTSIGKILYGLLFVVLLPAFLIAWAILSGPNVSLPAIGSFEIGLVAALCGAILMAAGTADLSRYGDGLPMSPYPPTQFVAKGIYRHISHPIYVGFSIFCIGAAVATHSVSGLWLVSPIVMCGCVAFVQGFEKQDLAKRFGATRLKPLISIPANEGAAPNHWDRLSVYLLVLLPWLILYEAVVVLGAPPDAVGVYLPFEVNLPVYEWTEIIYASTYVFVLVAPLLARSRRDLYQFSVSGLISTAAIILLFLVVPIVSSPRPFEPQSVLGSLLMFERSKDTAAAAFPSFHVVWALLAARVYVGRMPSLRIVWWGWAVLISISCVTTGMHALADVLSAFVVFLLVIRIGKVWELIRSSSERFANSWREWQFGRVRVINHGIFAGIGTFIGVSIVGILTGSRACCLDPDRRVFLADHIGAVGSVHRRFAKAPSSVWLLWGRCWRRHRRFHCQGSRDQHLDDACCVRSCGTVDSVVWQAALSDPGLLPWPGIVCLDRDSLFTSTLPCLQARESHRRANSSDSGLFDPLECCHRAYRHTSLVCSSSVWDDYWHVSHPHWPGKVCRGSVPGRTADPDRWRVAPLSVDRDCERACGCRNHDPAENRGDSSPSIHMGVTVGRSSVWFVHMVRVGSGLPQFEQAFCASRVKQ